MPYSITYFKYLFRYQVSWKDFMDNGGGPFLKLHDNSIIKALSSVFPEFQFLPWLFKKVPDGYFKSRENRTRYIEWLRRKVGVNASELSKTHFQEHNGYGLLLLYNSSPQAVLDSLKDADEDPSFKTEALQRSQKPRNYWAAKENRKTLLDSIGEMIGVVGSDLSPWYEVSVHRIKQFGASGLLRRYYGDSLYKMLSDVYPEYSWEVWRFKSPPRNVGRDLSLLKSSLDRIRSSLNIAQKEDWYRVSNSQISNLGVLPIINSNGGLVQSLQIMIPEVQWDPSKFSFTQKKPKQSQSSLK